MTEVCDEPLNVLLIVADELMAAALSCYGGTQIDTPGLDRLSAEGATFDAAYCNSPVCTPSRYSMLTGRYPWAIHVYHNQSPTPVDQPSIATMLGGRGYETVAIGKMHFKGDEQMWGYGSRPYGDFGGLSHQPDPLSSAPRLSFVADAGPADIVEDQIHDRIVGRMACEFLRARSHDRPFFLHLGLNFPHYPLRPPQRLFDKYFPDRADLPSIPEAPVPEHPWMRQRRAIYRDLIDDGSFTEHQIRRARAAYYACVEMMDEQVSSVLDVLDEQGLAEQTLVLFTADHGEMLGEYGTWEKNCFYEPSVRVPLLLRLAGVDPGCRVPAVVDLVDMFPTIEQATRGRLHEDEYAVDGQTLLPLVGSPGQRDKDYAISELAPTYVDALARMVRLDRWKYIAYDTYPPSLFDLTSDPDELEDRGVRTDFTCPDTRLESLSATDFALARRESDAADMAVHPPYDAVTPNQYRRRDGELIDAEDFYDMTAWARPPTAARQRVTRVRPRSLA